jgi:hypothetical protein
MLYYMNDDDDSELNSEQHKIPEDPDFEDMQQIAAGELTDDTTAGFLMVPYQDTENGERVPTLMSCDEGLINDPRAAYELYTSLAGMVPIGLAQNLEDMNLKGALNAIEYESRTTAGENPSDVRHEFGWQVKTPTVYRYLEQEYIDKFFEEGIIQLSSFAQFAEHEDEARNDSDEGVNIMTVEGDDRCIISVGAAGMDAYVFCGSTIASESLMKEFGVDGYFKINDTRSFAKEIAKSLEKSDDIKRVKKGVEGFCEYTDGNRIRKEAEIEIPESLSDGDYDGFRFERSEEEVPEPLKGRRDENTTQEEPPGDLKNITDDEEISVENIEAQINQAVGHDPLFIKDERFQEQSEYRWLWHIDGEMSSTIQIKCPEALEYCEKVT